VSRSWLSTSDGLRLSRHLCANLLMFVMAVVVMIYSQPYSLHQVVRAEYNEFDRTPESHGTVSFATGATVDFRLPQLSLHSDTIQELNDAVRLAQSKSLSDAASAFRVVELVRSRLGSAHNNFPSADTLTCEQLYRSGTHYRCLCSDYSRLTNECLQAIGLQSRIVWLEGHVVLEYFDSQLDQWVFLDAQNDLRVASAGGQPLSVSQLIGAMEHDEPLAWIPICLYPNELQPGHRDQLDDLHCRNVLRNGECYVVSGETLSAQGRWNQLLRYGSRPQVVVLATPFDTSNSWFYSPLRFQHILVFHAVIMLAVYLGRAVNRRNPGRIPEATYR
jgi:hypothetical protein